MMLLLSLAVMWLAGFALVRSLFPQPLRWSLHNVWLFSLGLGMGAGVASCLYFLTLVLADASVTVLLSSVGAVVVIAFALGLIAKRRRTLLAWDINANEAAEVPWYLTALFALAVALALVAFALAR